MNKLGSRTPDATPPALCRGFNGFCATASCATTSAKAVEPLGQAQGRLRDARGIQRQNRRGTILVITALVLIALVGLMGLVIDAGQLMTANRVAQNAADAAATGAAMDMLTGKSNSTASATATTFVQQYNGLANATVVVNIPPASGAHAGNSQYAEAIVTNSVPVWFIQILGVGSQQTVMARAVAGWEGAGFGAGVLVLDTNTRPGLTLNGNAELAVNGTVVVNSNGGGRNEYGQPINNGNSGSAISLLGNAELSALDIQSVGGVSLTGNAEIENYDSHNSQNPLHTGRPISPDPLLYLAAPTTSNGAVATNYGAVNLSGNSNATLSPGVYSSIRLSANATATFNPGIYVIKGGGFSVSGNANASGTGVMIYNTGSDYNVNTGLPDSGDLNQLPPASGGATFGSLSITGNGSVHFTPYSNPSSPFDGLVFYQRRLNTQAISISGNGEIGPFQGSIYAKWASMTVSGNGTYGAQFIVKAMTISGNGEVTVNPTGQHLVQPALVYLVE